MNITDDSGKFISAQFVKLPLTKEYSGAKQNQDLEQDQTVDNIMKQE